MQYLIYGYKITVKLRRDLFRRNFSHWLSPFMTPPTFSWLLSPTKKERTPFCSPLRFTTLPNLTPTGGPSDVTPHRFLGTGQKKDRSDGFLLQWTAQSVFTQLLLFLRCTEERRKQFWLFSLPCLYTHLLPPTYFLFAEGMLWLTMCTHDVLAFFLPESPNVGKPFSAFSVNRVEGKT